MKKALTFDDVLIIPRYSEVQSRFDPTTYHPAFDLDIPIISANMDSVTGTQMAVAMEKAGGMGVLHRFMDKDTMLRHANLLAQYNKRVAISLGIGDPNNVAAWAELLLYEGVDTLVIDVAHGHQKRVVECIEAIREMARRGNSNPTIIAGNIATAKAAVDLWTAGADAVKVGIGPGAACTTRTTTGIGYPQFSAIQEVAEQRAKFRLSGGGRHGYIIADGGIKNTADFCKAIAAGADAVMMGSVLAGADESNAEIEYEEVEVYDGYSLAGGKNYSLNTEPSGYKTYRGMASTKAREAFGIAASTGYNEHIAEGVEGRIECTGPVADTLLHYKKALQSSMSYVGAMNIAEFQQKAQFVKVTNNSILEGGPRV